MFSWIKIGVLKTSSIFAVSLLAGCGGGGSSSDGGDANTVVELTPGGYYTEIAFSNGTLAEAITLLSPTGKFVSVVDFTDITIGSLKFGSNSTVTGTGTDVFYDGTWNSVNGSLDGTVHNPSSATVTATAPAYESTVTLDRADAYSDLGVTLADLSGTYTMSDPSVYTTSVTIAADGTVTGSDETGCVFNGQVSIPDTAFNVYEVSYTASNCADSLRNGEFFGLGAYDPDLGEVEFAGTDGEVTGVFIGTR